MFYLPVCTTNNLDLLLSECAHDTQRSHNVKFVQVERTWDLVRDSGQRKLTSSFQNHCTLHSVPVGAKPLSPRQCAPSRSIYLSRRLNSHWEILVTTHHLQKWESQLRLRWNRRIISGPLNVRYLHFTSVSSRSLPPPIKAGRFPFAQNLVKLSHSLNRLPRNDSSISIYNMQNHRLSTFKSNARDTTHRLSLAAAH